jgi:photosystem II stability/assembly factor-like uncharacterized protein
MGTTMRPLLRILFAAALALAATAPAALAGWSPLGSPVRPNITLQLNPDHPEVLYARVFLSEGPEEDYLWRSEDGGASWRNIQSGLEQPVSALAIDPSNPRVIWAWTADAQLWRSGDAGETWTHRYTLPGFDPPQVFQLLVDPSHPETIYRVDFEGFPGTRVAVSRDGGATFSEGAFVPHVSGLDSIYPRPGHDELVSFDEKGLEVSTDGGQSWTLRGTIPHGFAGGRIAPSSPDVLYGLAYDTTQCLARSDDAGAHWTVLPHPPRVPVDPSHCYDVTIDPRDARHVWVAIEVAEVGRFRLVIAESRDGGTTWSRPLSPPTGSGMVAAGGDLLYTDGVRGEGLFVSRDGGHTWTAIDRGILAGDLRDGLVAQRPPHGGVGRRLLAINIPGGGDPEGLYRSDGGSDWIRTPLLSPRQVAGAGGSNVVALDQNGLQWSQNGGTSWQRLTSTPSPFRLLSDVSQPRYVGLQTFVPDDASGKTPLWASDDGGATWRRASRGLPVACSHVASVDVCPSFSGYTVDPFNASRRWLFVDEFNVQPSVFLSENAGTSWRAVAVLPKIPLALAADPRVEGRLLVGTQDGLLASEDAGRSWHPLGDLPAGAGVRQFAWDPLSATWYAATKAHGIYRSLDGGAHWTLLAGAPDHDNPTIAVDPRRPTALLAAFAGQGLWRWTP